MAYRNGTYVAFHANGTNIPGGKSDIDYYNLMRAWSEHPDDDFTMNNSHDKVGAVRDSSKRETLRRSGDVPSSVEKCSAGIAWVA